MKLLVVSYHYCREERENKGIHAISIQDFLKQVELLGRHFNFISLDDINSWIQMQKVPDGKYCLLTFDDGLKEQMECFKLLQSKGIPGAFFVVTDTVESNRVCTIHKFHYARSVLEDAEVYQLLDQEFNLSEYDFGQQLEGRYIYDNEYARKIKYFFSFCLNEDQKEIITSRLFTHLGMKDREFLQKFYMSYDDVIDLSSADMLGSHTTQHEPLTMLPEESLSHVLLHSKNYLESITGKDIHSVSYPSGRGNGMNLDVAKMAEKSGYRFGFTVNYGINDANMLLNNSFELLRVSTNDAPGGSRDSNEYIV